MSGSSGSYYGDNATARVWTEGGICLIQDNSSSISLQPSSAVHLHNRQCMALGLRSQSVKTLREVGTSPVFSFYLLLARLHISDCSGARLVTVAGVSRRRLSASVTLSAGRPASRVGVGRPRLHSGPVRLRPYRATPCFLVPYATLGRSAFERT